MATLHAPQLGWERASASIILPFGEEAVVFDTIASCQLSMPTARLFLCANVDLGDDVGVGAGTVQKCPVPKLNIKTCPNSGGSWLGSCCTDNFLSTSEQYLNGR